MARPPRNQEKYGVQVWRLWQTGMSYPEIKKRLKSDLTVHALAGICRRQRDMHDQDDRDLNILGRLENGDDPFKLAREFKVPPGLILKLKKELGSSNEKTRRE